MSGSINEYLIAENNTEHQEHGTAQTTAHTAHSDGNIPPSEVFPTLLGTLGEHREMTFYNVHICNLPVIVYDKDTGLLTYSSVESMENDGVYTLDHHTHQIVKSSNHESPTLDMSITSLVVFEWLAMFFVILVFLKSAKKYKKNSKAAPKGLQNMIEAGVVFVRDDIVGPNINNKDVVNRLLPFFVVLFFFILFMNLIGLVPGGHTATGSLAVTAALAICAFFIINVTQIRDVGIKAYLKHLLGGAPIALAPIMIPIEILSMFTKPFALTVRLFANMTAGHVVLLSLVGLIFYFKSFVVSPVSVGFSIFMYFIEILVAFLQAYIFVILTAVFTGLGMSHDHTEH